jgi:hypothetical protein
MPTMKPYIFCGSSEPLFALFKRDHGEYIYWKILQFETFGWEPWGSDVCKKNEDSIDSENFMTYGLIGNQVFNFSCHLPGHEPKTSKFSHKLQPEK